MSTSSIDRWWQTIRPLRKVGKLRGVLELPVFSVPTGPDDTSFEATESYLTGAPVAAMFGGTAASMEAWVKPMPGIITTGQRIIRTQYQLTIMPDLTVQVIWRSTVPTVYTLNGSLQLNMNQWNHVAATNDGTTIRLYINGIQDGVTAAFVGPFQTGTGATLFRLLDTFNDTAPLRANEIRIWSKALTLTEITSHATSPRNIDGTIDTGLLGYWPLGDASDGTIVPNDIVANAFNLTVTSYLGATNRWSWVEDDSYPYKLGASYIAGWFLVDTSGRSFSLKFPVRKPSSTVNFVPCVSWVTDTEIPIVMRYRLWTQASLGTSLFDSFQPIPLYNGQLIPDGAKIEIWNLDGERSVDSATAIDIETSILNVVTDVNTTVLTATATLAVPVITDIAEPFPLTPFPLTFTSPQTVY